MPNKLNSVKKKKKKHNLESRNEFKRINPKNIHF